MARSVRSEERVEQRRRQIVEAAIRVFTRKGFHAASVREIAREAGIADGTMYLYFTHKTDLLPAIFALLREAAPPDAVFTDLLANDVRGFLRAFFWHPLLALQRDNFALFRALLP